MVIPPQSIERRIYWVRGQKIMLDSDLAALYQVETKQLNQAVKRNPARFPEDFMFQLTGEEVEDLKSQTLLAVPTDDLRSHFVTSNAEPLDASVRGGRRYRPYAFTEHGIAMLSSVLKSERAAQVNILIVRAFVQLRDMLSTHRDLAIAIDELRRGQADQGEQIEAIIEAVNKLLEPPPVSETGKRRIGFAAS